MKASLTILALGLALFDAAIGQQPVPVSPQVPTGVPSPGRRMLTSPRLPGMPGSQEEPVDLNRNYKLTFALKTGEKGDKEVALLTASSQIRLNTVMEADNPAMGSINAEVSGTLTEKEDGKLRLSYNISAGIPVTTQSGTQYITENASGVLVIELGKTYEIFKSSTRSYLVTVSPDGAGKGK